MILRTPSVVKYSFIYVSINIQIHTQISLSSSSIQGIMSLLTHHSLNTKTSISLNSMPL